MFASSSAFKINTTSFTAANGTLAVLNNQFPEPVSITNDPRENQILFITNEGTPTSTANFVFIPNVQGATGRTNLLGVYGDIQVNGNAAFLSHIGVGQIENGRYVEIAADTVNNSYIDFHSRDTFSTDYDARILSNGGGTTGATGNGNGNLFFSAASANFDCPIRAGSWSAPPVRIDYGFISNIDTTNQTGEHFFVPNLFSEAPNVTLTFQSSGPISGSDPGIFVKSSTCESFIWQVHGTPPVGSRINWTAMGI